MSRLTCQRSISLDGYVAGPDQSLEDPLGRGGERLHEWAFGKGGQDPVDARIAEEVMQGAGAYVMGRGMFGGGDGPWDPAWRGWWGEDPPYHAPVFVLSHHPRELLAMRGGTTFSFVTGGIDSALALARAAAGARRVVVAGGASTARQFLRAGLLDELHLHLVPIVLGAGERLLEEAGGPVFEPVEVTASPAATHMRYRVVR